MKVSIRVSSRNLEAARVGFANLVMRYLEGVDLTPDEVSKLRGHSRPRLSAVPLYRTFRAGTKPRTVSRSLPFKRELVSTASTVEASLYAARSYASDYKHEPKYFLVYEFLHLSVLFDTQDLEVFTRTSSVLPVPLAPSLHRLEVEKEVIVLGGCSYKGRLVQVGLP